MSDEEKVIEPGLYVVGTPIGNLEDITLRALRILKGVDFILAEDTRYSLRLLRHYDIHTKLISCHKFNEASREEQITSRLAAGEKAALISDCGMPGISDPGSRTVRGCREAGVPVFAVPGPSAVTTAVSLCGWGDNGFTFAGFLSPKPGKRRNTLEPLLEGERPVLLYESPHKIVRLIDLLVELVPDRQVAIARELTKKFEELLVGSPAELKEICSQRTLKGEMAVLIQGRPKKKRE